MARVGRNRGIHKRMPKGWMPSASGTIYFRPTNAGDREIVQAITGGPKCVRLGDDVDAAATSEVWLRILTDRKVESEIVPGTVSEIVDLARREMLPTIKNKKTRGERTRHLDALLALFGQKRYALNVFDASRDSKGLYLRAMDIQRHIFKGKEARRVSVNREVRSWELFFQWARAPGGLTEYNPCTGLMDNEEKPRRVVPQDGSIFKLYRELSPPARFMVGMIRFYGRRKVEILGLEETSAQEDGIHFRRGKDAEAKEIIVKWDPRNRRMWARAARWRAKVLRPLIEEKVVPVKRKLPTAFLLNRRGRAVTESGFNTERKRAMVRSGLSVFLGEEQVNGKKVKRYQHPFTFHDMRKSRAGDGLTLEQAQNVLAHDEQRTTAVIYRPGAIVVDLNDEVNLQRLKGNSQKR